MLKILISPTGLLQDADQGQLKLGESGRTNLSRCNDFPPTSTKEPCWAGTSSAMGVAQIKLPQNFTDLLNKKGYNNLLTCVAVLGLT